MGERRRGSLTRRKVLALGVPTLGMTVLGLPRSSNTRFYQGSRPQFRAFWVDAFHPGFKTRFEVDNLISDALTANVNALLIQVRRRGDGYYLNSLEPLAEDATRGFDALAYTSERAHRSEIEVHAFAVVMPVWSSFLGAPSSPQHVFNLHGPSAPGRANWMNQDNYGSAQGPGGAFYLDPGHPDGVDYTVNVLLHIVKNYQIDGLHLDYIRYPEGGNWGYNPVSIERFQRRFGRSDIPTPNDPDFKQWRREQVTNMARRIYLNMLAVNPKVKLSVAAIAWKRAPIEEPDWLTSDAYTTVYQDWVGWLKEGIVDMAIPMNYDREHCSSQQQWFNDWIEWEKNHKFRRHVVIGIAAYLNSLPNTISQTRRALADSSRGNSAEGVALYSYASTENLSSACTGYNAIWNPQLYTSLSQPSPYDPDPVPVFAERVPTPEMSWKVSPGTGHIMGAVTLSDGSKLDGGNITIEQIDSGQVLGASEARTDGSGFFSILALEPGLYRITVKQGHTVLVVSEPLRVDPGRVTTVNVAIR